MKLLQAKVVQFSHQQQLRYSPGSPAEERLEAGAPAELPDQGGLLGRRWSALAIIICTIQ